MSKRARDEDASLPQQPRRKRLGASDIEVCEVCLGTMTFGSMTADEATCHQILDRYVALGGNFIDTARAAPNPDAKPKPKPKPNLTAGRLPQLSDERVRPAGQYKTPALGRAPGPLDCLLAPGPKWAPGPLDAREASLRAAPPVDPLPSLYIRAHHGSLRPARRADRERFCLWPCTLQARLADAERQVQHALRDRARPVPRRRRRQGQGALNWALDDEG